jgi:hypothetical protein
MINIADILSTFWNGERYDRPTLIAWPSRELARKFAEACTFVGLPVGIITDSTKHKIRASVFEQTVACKIALSQVNVVGEGVNLPIRRIIDAKPMMSPVAWLQLLGRETRPVKPGEKPPEYICTNRNLMRHAYLLDGLLPADAVRKNDEAFGGISKRRGIRAVGLEAIGRFKGVELKFIDGLKGMMYALNTCVDNKIINYVAIEHPLYAEPIWAKKTDTGDADGKLAWGKYVRVLPPTDLKGFSSIPPKEPTPGQLSWWRSEDKQKGAKYYGLAEDDPTRKQFEALPVLANIGMRIKNHDKGGPK